jgi:hypothetical protein
MKVQICNDVYFVEWRHYNSVVRDKWKKFNNQTFASTECFITQNEKLNKNKFVSIFAQGQAVLSKYDTYDKNKGRKVSLAKALKLSGFDKAHKYLIWKAYFEMRGEKFLDEV